MTVTDIFIYREQLEKEILKLEKDKSNITQAIRNLKNKEIFDPFSIIKNNNDITLKNKYFKIKSDRIDDIESELKKLPQKICSELSKSVLEYHENIRNQNEKNMKHQKYMRIIYYSSLFVSTLLFTRTIRKILRK